MTSSFDVAIIGAGIVGLASGLQLLAARPGLSICILEKEDELAAHQSSRNSGVIHSGIYYKPGSQKALNCREGYRLLLNFAERHDIPHDICGKVIVATREAELPLLDTIFDRGRANGLKQLRKLSREELKEIEPHAEGIRAIWVPQAGIIDYKDVAEKFAELIRRQGGRIFTGQQVGEILIRDGRALVISGEKVIRADVVVNCAGLYADKVAAMTSPENGIRILPFRGEYYELVPERRHLVRNLIYPVPDPAFPFLGVHFTRMIKGGVEAGPNAVLAFRREGYRRSQIHLGELSETLLFPGFRRIALKYGRTGLQEMRRSFSKRAFVRSLQKLVPEIEGKDVIPGRSGVRAQACDRQGYLIDDFLITRTEHIVNVWNAPSPAATSSIAIGSTIARLALEQVHQT